MLLTYGKEVVFYQTAKKFVFSSLFLFATGCASMTSPTGHMSLLGSGSKGCLDPDGHIDADGSIHGSCVIVESKFTDLVLALAGIAATFGF